MSAADFWNWWDLHPLRVFSISSCIEPCNLSALSSGMSRHNVFCSVVLASSRDWLFWRFGGDALPCFFKCDLNWFNWIKRQCGGRKCVRYRTLFEGDGLPDDRSSTSLWNLGTPNHDALQKHKPRTFVDQKPLWQTEHLRINNCFVPRPPPFWPS